jgi:hypothetical protein
MYSLLGVAILEEDDEVSREFCLPPTGREKGPRAVCFVRGMMLNLQFWLQRVAECGCSRRILTELFKYRKLS